jgi:hypothetical protein
VPVARDVVHDEPDGGAAAVVADETDEGEAVAAGEKPDPSGRDGRPAGGARCAVGERARAIAGTHRPQVYRSDTSRGRSVVIDTPGGYNLGHGAGSGATIDEGSEHR